MFDAHHSKRSETERMQAASEQKPTSTKQGRTQQTGHLTHIPAYAQAWGNQPPPWLRLSSVGHPLKQSESDQGSPLPDSVRDTMEVSLNADLSDVRIHKGPVAAALGARAFTRGSHLHFNHEEYDFSSHHGRELLGHELAHVIQQREGRVHGSQESSDMFVLDSALEAEADILGTAVARGETVRHGPRLPAPTSPIAGAQRQGKLIVVGAHANDLILFLSQYTGLRLSSSSSNNYEVSIIEEQAEPQQASQRPNSRLKLLLETIINDPTDYAELSVRTGGSGVFIGGFPQPPITPTGSYQLIDWSHIQQVIAVDPELAAVLLAHEIAENYEAHKSRASSTDPFELSHNKALEVEREVSVEFGGIGRLAESTVGSQNEMYTWHFFDYGLYYLAIAYSEEVENKNKNIEIAEKITSKALTKSGKKTGNDLETVINQIQDIIPKIQSLPQSTIHVTHKEIKDEVVKQAGIKPQRVGLVTPTDQAPYMVLVKYPDQQTLEKLDRTLNEHQAKRVKSE